jgi:hypothetical protein
MPHSANNTALYDTPKTVTAIYKCAKRSGGHAENVQMTHAKENFNFDLPIK